MDRADIRQRIGRHLRENLLPFWTRRTWDESHGGFIGHVGDHGIPTGVTDKYLLIQSRIVWTLSAAHRHGITDQRYLELAGRGFRFMVDRMWDEKHGGFFHAVRRDGSILIDWKWVYAQAYVIFAFSEYFLASNDEEALAWARRTFDVLENKGREGNAGWKEFLRRDWGPRWRRQRQRTSGSHLHLMEAFDVLYQASGEAKHRDALEFVTDLLVSRTLHASGCLIDKFSLDWSPRRSIDFQVTTSYGHCAELAFLLTDACRTLGRPARDYVAVATRLLDYAIDNGFDRERGGLADYGTPGKHVRDSWTLRPRRHLRGEWQQAEFLPALLRLHELTGDAKYLDVFAKQFEWIWTHQIDHVGGAWFASVNPDGTPHDRTKGNSHRCCYHNGRALIECEKIMMAGRREAFSSPSISSPVLS